MTIFFLFLGATSLELFSFWFFDIINIIFFEVMLILHMRVGCSIGEIALAALAKVVSALWVFSLPPRAFAVLLHTF